VRSLFDAYAAGEARAFFAADFGDPEERRALVRAVARPLAPAVADALAAQNAALGESAARAANLDALRRGAAAVVTGQQVGLFLGPLFTLYKAASAVAVARALAAESGTEVVPIFWIQNEDHDLPEIAECHVPGAAGEPCALRLECAPQRRSLAHLALPAEVADCLARLRAEIGRLPHADEHLGRLERHYRAGAGWSAAFAGLLAELFAGEGLVLLDPRDPAIARAAAPVHRRALEQAGELAAALLERNRVLADAGFAPAVHVRAGAPLSFFHPEGAAGPRFRLEPAGDGFAEIGGQGHHTSVELLAALARDPLCFSCSALLRPIAQDALLPTAAYVAGPGEVAYFAQLAPLYAAYGLRQPLVVPRARLRLIDERAERALARLGLRPEDAARSEDDLLAATAPAHDDLERRLRAPFEQALRALAPEIEHAGDGIDTAVEKTRASVAAAVGKLAAKVERARLHRDEQRVHDVHLLRSLLQPDGLPQERRYGLAWFAARYGEHALLTRVLDAIDPFDPNPRDVLLGGEQERHRTRAHASAAPLALALVCYPTFGGSGVVAAELALALARRGHRVHLLSGAPPSRALPPCENLRFQQVSAAPYPLFEHPQYALAVASALVDLARAERLDLVHVHYAVPHAASAYLARQALGPAAPRIVTTLHGTDVTRVGVDPSYRSITRFAVAASDALTVPSDALRRAASEDLGLGERAIETIANFVDTDHFRPPPRRERARLTALFPVGGEGPVLFHVSNFRPIKRTADLLQVLLRLRRHLPARLVLVGDGPERGACERLARQLGLEDSVCFLGRRTEFAAELSHADAFLLPSESESFGVAAAEALSAGVPVFGYRVGGLPEVVSESSGRLVAPYDLDALAAAVREVVADPERQAAMSRAARADALLRFRREPAVDRYEALFRRVLAQRARLEGA